MSCNTALVFSTGEPFTGQEDETEWNGGQLCILCYRELLLDPH